MFLLTLSSSWTSFAMSSSASAGTSSWTSLWFNYSGLLCLAITWYRYWFPLLERVKQGSSNVNDFEWNGVVHSPLSLISEDELPPFLHDFCLWCCLCWVYPQSSFSRMTVQFTGLPWSLTKFFNMILAHLGLITSIYISALQTVTKAPFDRDVIRTIWFCSYASFI